MIRIHRVFMATLVSALAVGLLGWAAGLATLAGLAVLASKERGVRLPRLRCWPRADAGLRAAFGRLALPAVGAVVLAGALGVWCLAGAQQAKATVASLTDWRNDPFFAAMHRGQGMVAIVAGVSSTQLRGRCPVLLEVSSLNQLPYVPASGPEMNRILRGVYGEDLLAGPRGGKRRPGLDPQAVRPLWEQRDVAEWQRLGREFGIGQVMAYRRWQLQLPVVAKNRQFTLYRIPDPSGRIHD